MLCMCAGLLKSIPQRVLLHRLWAKGGGLGMWH